MALYDGEIAWVDSQVQRLSDGLQSRGARDLLTIVTADHGEEFFEHGHKTHRKQLWRESLHVPLIVHWKGRVPAGLTVGGDVGLIDVAPTIYGLLGIEAPPGMSGADLSSVARGTQPNAVRGYTSIVLRFDRGPIPERSIALRFDGFTLIENQLLDSAPTRLLLDRRNDPMESGDGRPVAVGDKDAARLDAVLDELRASYRRQRDLQPHRGGRGLSYSESELAELRAMGYIADGERPIQLEAPADLGSESDRLAIDGGRWPSADAANRIQSSDE